MRQSDELVPSKVEQTIFKWYTLPMASIDQLDAVTAVMALPGGVIIRTHVRNTSIREVENYGPQTDEQYGIDLVWVPGITMRLDSNQNPILIGR